jgi:predicted 3-demethylubiquinone-9 3-methyltransferase (glyoxalase superfamily)
MQKITPCLWFDNNAEEAAKFYTSIFKNSKIGKISRYGKEGYEIHGKPEGTVFNEAISFQVHCKTQNELDYYWEKLSKGGDEKAQQCGWLKDRYGVSWQIVPIVLSEMLQDKNTEKSERVMKAMLQMKKLDIKTLEQAYKQG